MAPVAAEILRDWDATAASLGPMPRYNAEGEIIPVGKQEGRKIYVVWVGRAVGLFYNWGLANAMVCGFSGSTHKGYRNLHEARLGWEQGPPGRDGGWLPPAPRLAIPTPEDDLAGDAPSSGGGDRASATGTPRSIQYVPLHPADRARIYVPAGLVPPSPEDDSSDEEFHDVPPASRSPSPTPSSFSLASSHYLHAFPPLTDGTITPGTIYTPALRMPDLPVAKDGRAARPRAQDPRASGLMREPTAAGQEAADGEKEIYVVVRGDFPGIYTDRHTALVKLGFNPGMKLVVFDSLSRAALYFAYQYMAGKVGVPELVVDDA